MSYSRSFESKRSSSSIPISSWARMTGTVGEDPREAGRPQVKHPSCRPNPWVRQGMGCPFGQARHIQESNTRRLSLRPPALPRTARITAFKAQGIIFHWKTGCGWTPPIDYARSIRPPIPTVPRYQARLDPARCAWPTDCICPLQRTIHWRGHGQGPWPWACLRPRKPDGPPAFIVGQAARGGRVAGRSGRSPQCHRDCI